MRVTYWRDIPVLVTARVGAEEVSLPLPPGFQDLVDRVALQEGLAESAAYLGEWRVGAPEERPGSAESAAGRVAAELAAGLEGWRARYLSAPLPGDPT